jgi:hypothetical protein
MRMRCANASISCFACAMRCCATPSLRRALRVRPGLVPPTAVLCCVLRCVHLLHATSLHPISAAPCCVVLCRAALCCVVLRCRSLELPPFWECGKHDRGLVLGIHCHGLGSWSLIFADRALGFDPAPAPGAVTAAGIPALPFLASALLADHNLILRRLNEVLALFQAGVDLSTVQARYARSVLMWQAAIQQQLLTQHLPLPPPLPPLK